MLNVLNDGDNTRRKLAKRDGRPNVLSLEPMPKRCKARGRKRELEPIVSHPGTSPACNPKYRMRGNQNYGAQNLSLTHCDSAPPCTVIAKVVAKAESRKRPFAEIEEMSSTHAPRFCIRNKSKPEPAHRHCTVNANIGDVMAQRKRPFSEI